MPSPSFGEFRSQANAPVMQEVATGTCPRLLTVKEVAARLCTSTATVHALCERCELAHVRISTHAIRISEPGLAMFIRSASARRT